MNTSLRKGVMALAAISMLLTGNLQAAMVSFQLTGTVTEAYDGFNGPNYFGLDVGDQISVTGLYDDSSLTGSGAEFISFGSTSGNLMTLEVGSMTFDQAADTQYNSGFPRLLFMDGDFDGLNYDTQVGSEGYFNSAGALKTFDGWDDDFGNIYGTWNAGTFTTNVVPVPAAVWLLGSGLLALVGLARRQARA